MRATVRVPATSANLGPGFDCLAMAWDLCNDVTVDTDGPPGVTWEGEGAGELPVDGSDLVTGCMRRAARDVGGVLPEMAVHGVNRIPIERGLGSSAAAVVAGLVLAGRVAGRDLDPQRLLSLAAEIEGHPDNVAAAIHGGLTIAYATAAGAPAAVRLDPWAGLRPVVLVPIDVRLATSAARDAVPRRVPLQDAAFNAGRAALAVTALTQRPDLLGAALDDRLHQHARLELVPPVRGVFEDLRRARVPVCVSGAGPSLLAFESDGREVADPGAGWLVLRVSPRPTGAELLGA